MAAENGVFEIMHTTRAMRRLKPDPVPDELIRKILLAGQAAANGGNTQRWRFLVLKNTLARKSSRAITRSCSTKWSGPAIATARRPSDRINRSNCGKWRRTNT